MKGLPWTNALAYYRSLKITAVKSFITLGPGCITDTVEVGEVEVAEFMAAAAAAAAAAAWAWAAGVVPLGNGLAEAAGISITEGI